MKLFSSDNHYTMAPQHNIKGLIILPPKQMLQRLMIVLAQVQASNTTESSEGDQTKCLFIVLSKTNFKEYNNLMKLV